MTMKYAKRHMFLFNESWLIMPFSFVKVQTVSWAIGLATVVAWKRYSFQMVVLNVVSKKFSETLLATHFANGWCLQPRCSISIFCPIGKHSVTFLHHWVHLLGQSFSVDSIVFTITILIWNCFFLRRFCQDFFCCLNLFCQWRRSQ